MKSQIIFFVGKPGSGKGTQAALLSKKTGWPVVSTSGGLREIAAGSGAVGHKLKETMDAGILLPHWIVSYLYVKTMLTVSDNDGLIFDGTSRTPPEAQVILESLKWLGKPFTIFHLTVAEDSVRARVELRKEKEARKDDHMMDTRIEEYYANTEPAIDIYRQAGILTDVDGEGTPEEIARTVLAILESK